MSVFDFRFYAKANFARSIFFSLRIAVSLTVSETYTLTRKNLKIVIIVRRLRTTTRIFPGSIFLLSQGQHRVIRERRDLNRLTVQLTRFLSVLSDFRVLLLTLYTHRFDTDLYRMSETRRRRND